MFKWVFFTFFVTSPSHECRVSSLLFGSSIPVATRWSQFVTEITVFLGNFKPSCSSFETWIVWQKSGGNQLSFRVESVLFGQVLTRITFPDCGKVLCLVVICARIWVWLLLCSSKAEIITVHARRHHLKSCLGLVQLYHAARASTKSTYANLQNLI
jgi:hypothetical protein